MNNFISFQNNFFGIDYEKMAIEDFLATLTQIIETFSQ
jgi:hypothetical protein